MSSSRNKFTLLKQNSVKLDVSVGFHPQCWCPSDGHHHGISIQISINFGKTFLWISHMYSIQWFLWPKSWHRSVHIYLVSFPRFWTLSIEQFWFLFWSILNDVTLKTSNYIEIWKEPVYTIFFENYPYKPGFASF